MEYCAREEFIKYTQRRPEIETFYFDIYDVDKTTLKSTVDLKKSECEKFLSDKYICLGIWDLDEPGEPDECCIQIAPRGTSKIEAIKNEDL